MCNEATEILFNKQWLVNDENKIVEEALTGLVRCNPHLALLDIGNVVVRKFHLTLDKVKIISGGASGHEPSFAGFVGKGMLTAAVQGEVFCSPTTHCILRTLKELARRHDKGLLVIIGNNLSDRLTFGLAVERIKNVPNVKIRFLMVSDCIRGHQEPFGLMGTILVQKIAGAMSEADFTLHEIHLYCKNIAKNIATVVVTLKPAESPLYEVASCAADFAEKEVEFGSGVHGQPGYMKVALLSCHEIVSLVITQITNPELNGSITLEPDTPVVIVINNMGYSSTIEHLIFINEIIIQLHQLKVEVIRVYCSSFYTSLKMAGLSFTILKLVDKDILTYLSVPCEAPFWKSFGEFLDPTNRNLVISTKLDSREIRNKPMRGPRIVDELAEIISNALTFACGALISCEKQLNIIDSESGDADTGTNLKLPCQIINDYLTKNKIRIHWPFVFLEELSKILENSSGGLLAHFYAIMFEAAAQPFYELHELDSVNYNIWCKAFEAALNALARYGKTKFGQLTMYDAMYAANESFKLNVDIKMCSIDKVGIAVMAAEEAAQKTRMNQKEQPDPGAHAVGIWMRAVYEALKLKKHLFDGDFKKME